MFLCKKRLKMLKFSKTNKPRQFCQILLMVEGGGGNQPPVLPPLDPPLQRIGS